MENYLWYPTECAANHYPAEILKADFIFPNGDSIYIPDGRVIRNGWGEVGSTHLVGEDEKPIPNKMEVVWFSYTEDKFYAGTFNLPSNFIEDLFKKGIKKHLEQEQGNYRYIIAGLAPGGFVAIWAAGEGWVTEIATFKATETKIEWKDFFDNPEVSRKQYVEETLAESIPAEILAKIKRRGVPKGLWDTYAIKHDWSCTIIGKATPIDAWIKTYNGERQYFLFDGTKKLLPNKRAIPKKIDFNWKSSLGKEYYSIIEFNETEIFAAFDKLTKEITSEKLVLQIQINESSYSLKIFLNSEKYSLELKETIVKVYSI